MPDDLRKASGERCTALHPGRTTAARHEGRDKGKGERLRTVGGYRGGGERRQEQERKRGRHDEAKMFGVA